MQALIVLSILGLAGWWWLLRDTPGGLGGRAPAGEWRLADAVFCGALALFFIYGVFADDGAEVAFTPEVINSSLVIFGMVILLVAGMAFGRGQTPQQAFGLAPARPLRVAGIGAACIVLVYPILELVGMVLAMKGNPVGEDDGMVRYFRDGLTAGDFAMAAAMVVVAAPLAEEALFRGYIYGVVKKYAGRVSSILVTSLLFAAVHHNLAGLPVLFLLGVSLTLAYELTGSLWAPIVMHTLFNSATLAIILWFPEWIR